MLAALTIAALLSGACAGLGNATVSVAWTHKSVQMVTASPTLGDADAVVWYGSGDGIFYTLWQDDGTVLWQRSVSMGVTSSAAVSCLDNQTCETVYVGLEQSLVALNASSGATLWAFQTADWVHSSPTLAPSLGAVFVGSDNGNVYSLNMSSGAQLWLFATGGMVRTAPVLNATSGVVVVGSSDMYVYGLSAANGSALWKYVTVGPVVSSAAMLGGVSFVGSQDGNVYALHTLTGALLWRYATGNGIYSSAAVSPAGTGSVYVTSSDGSLYALAPADGRVQWAFQSPAPIYSSPALSADFAHIAFGCDDMSVYYLTTSNDTSFGGVGVRAGAGGAVVWSFPTLGLVRSTPALSADGHRLFVGSNDDNLYALSF